MSNSLCHLLSQGWHDGFVNGEPWWQRKAIHGPTAVGFYLLKSNLSAALTNSCPLTQEHLSRISTICLVVEFASIGLCYSRRNINSFWLYSTYSRCEFDFSSTGSQTTLLSAGLQNSSHPNGIPHSMTSDQRAHFMTNTVAQGANSMRSTSYRPESTQNLSGPGHERRLKVEEEKV